MSPMLDDKLREMRQEGLNISRFIVAAVEEKLDRETAVRSELAEMRQMLTRLTELHEP